MSGKQIKKLRRAIKNAGHGLQSKEYFMQGKRKKVVMTLEMHQRAFGKIMGIKDEAQKNEELRNLPKVGDTFEIVVGKHVVADQDRGMYREFKKVYHENKGGGNGFKTVRDHIERNSRSYPVGTVSSDAKGEGVSEHTGSDASAPAPEVRERQAEELAAVNP